MKILYLCHRLPFPPNKGCKIRAFHQLRTLGRRHRVHLLTLADNPADLPLVPKLEEICSAVEVFPVSRAAGYLRCAARLAGRSPLTLSFFDSPPLWERVKELAQGQRFDAIVAYSSSMAPYVAPFTEVPRLLDMVDVDSAKWDQYARFAPPPWSWVYAIEAKRLEAYEREISEGFDGVVLSTSQESALLKCIAPQARPTSVPNGVDTDYFRPLDLERSPNPTLVFTGQMDYFANVDGVVHFARSVFPQLRRRFADLELVIVGRSPTARVRALAELPGIAVTGSVADVRPFLARAWAFVAPLRIAQGIQNKVLEAIASNVPVVVSERVFRGLGDGGFEAGRDLLVARGDEDYEEALAAILTDPAVGRRLARSARRRLAAAYSWEGNLAVFERLLAEVKGCGSPRAGQREAARAHAAPVLVAEGG